ncbi:hypothetical protein K1719_016916 [Acacia pycnantha]|nr:hypothetical protein K1719_016916 [Acacia pycnantha]
MMKTGVFLQFLLLLALGIGATLSVAEFQYSSTPRPHAAESFNVSYIQMKTVESCPYTVVISTSCTSTVRTKDQISIAFGDAYGNQIYAPRLDDPTSNAFERCSTDTFQLNGPCAYQICYVYFYRSGHDGWKPRKQKYTCAIFLDISWFFFPPDIWCGHFRLDHIAMENQRKRLFISNFRISKPLQEKLKEKGIEYLLPIQARTFDTILDGSNLLGRARTGQGKTLAFVLPILESLTNGPAKASREAGYVRSPSVLVLVPTRELASQVFSEFEIYGEALGLISCCLSRGPPPRDQVIKLNQGVDIAVGTPGRIKDHIERKKIDLTQLRFCILDESDEILRKDFVEVVEFILGKVEDFSKVQTLLFSSTLPEWVNHISSRFLKPDKKTVDLVENENIKASTNVRHLVLPCSSATSQLILDIIHLYSSGCRTIIFTETKESASELAGLLPRARALHGDIQFALREVTLSDFRSGKFMTLVATNLVARGLDINDVKLIIQCEPPRDADAYIHRSGSTGRAGNAGVAVMLYDPTRPYILSKIETESGVKFEHISAPQPANIAKAVGGNAAEMVNQVSNSVIPPFKRRWLLTSTENCVTLLLETARPIFAPFFASQRLKRFLPKEKFEAVKGLTLTVLIEKAVFDVPVIDLDIYLAG